MPSTTFKVIREALAEVHEVKAFFIANISLGLFFILILVSLDVEVLDGHISRLFSMSLEVFVAVTFVALQILLIAGMLVVQYRKRRRGIAELLRGEENEQLELKSSLRWDYELRKVNKELEHAVLKTIAGFLNTSGGTLLIGVSDDKQVLGLEHDWATLKRKDGDGFVQHLARLMSNELGNTLLPNVSIAVVAYAGEQICRVDVWPSKDPVFLAKGQREEFYIRIVNMTVSLPTKQAFMYIEKRKKSQ